MSNQAYIIVVGNEKGGAGKTTTSMHLLVSLMKLGFNVGSIDVDSRQLSLSRYLENRRLTVLRTDTALDFPDHKIIKKSPFNNMDESNEDEQFRFIEALNKTSVNNDFVVVDTPGSDCFLSRLAHSFADTIITPINDSFLDLDVLAKIEHGKLDVERPGIYSQMVWEQKLARAKRDKGEEDWIILRNRLSFLDAKNKRNIAEVLNKLSKRIGCRVVPGFGERVIFRELFLKGMTLLDVMDVKDTIMMNMSHIAARQELRSFMRALNIPRVNERLIELGEHEPQKQEEPEVDVDDAGGAEPILLELESQ